MTNFIYSKLVSLDKPTNAGAYQQPKNYAFAALSVSEMAEKIGEGRAWRAGIYAEDTTNFKKTSVEGSFVLALDFDNNTHSPEEVTDYAANIAFPANFYYYSYSQGIKPNNNFRVVWVLDEMITSNEYENIYPLLLGAFADYSPDRATKDASRLWYGTSKGVVVLREETIERSTLGAMTTAQGLKEGGNLRNIRKQKKTLGLDYADEPLPDPTYINDGWWERLRGVCPQWDKWEQGIYMPHNERLVLMANLRFLRYSDTSKHVINDVLRFYNAATYAGHTCDERQIASWFRSNLAPQRIVRKFGLEFTVGEYLAMPESKVRLNATDRITIEELDAALDEQIPRILNRVGIDYIKSQTGGGKTERIIEWLTQQDLSQKKIIYAAPTYDLIDEFYARLKFSEQKWHTSHLLLLDRSNSNQCESDDFYVENLENNITRLPRSLYTERDLQLMSLGLSRESKDPIRTEAIRRLLNYENKGLFIVTHSLISILGEIQADLIIIDENIEGALLQNQIITTDQLLALRHYIPKEYHHHIFNVAAAVEAGKRGAQVNVADLADLLLDNFQLDNYLENEKNKAAGLFNLARYPAQITRRDGKQALRMVSRSRLISYAIASGTPIKLFSATLLDKYLAAMYDTMGVNVVETEYAKNKGRIIQYRGNTGAKGNKFSKVESLVAYAKRKLTPEIIANSLVISFKDSEAYWESEGFTVAKTEEGKIIHLANNAGLDILKGKNIIVAGKYDEHEDYYIDMYYDLHPNAQEEPKRIKQRILLNGIYQTLFVFDDPIIRDIQLQKIGLAVEQSCGRARVLREEGATVYLFCNYTTPDVDEIRE